MNLYAYVQGDPINAIDPNGWAKYQVYWDYTSVSIGPPMLGAAGAMVTGVAVSMDRRQCGPCEGKYEAIRFKGFLVGVSQGVPIGYNENNTGTFDDNYLGQGDVQRIRGDSSLISGTAALGGAGKSKGSYNFGELSFTNDGIANASGFDGGLDYLPFGSIDTVGGIFCVESPYFGK